MIDLQKLLKNIPLSSESKVTVMLRTLGFKQWPLLALTRPKVLELNEYRCRIQMPFSRMVRNHLNSFYFGALAMGADACVGVLAYDIISQANANISLVFKAFEVQFLRRAEGPVTFTCLEGPKVKALIEQCIASGERVHQWIEAEAYEGNEKVCHFRLELSLKEKK